MKQIDRIRRQFLCYFGTSVHIIILEFWPAFEVSAEKAWFASNNEAGTIPQVRRK